MLVAVVVLVGATGPLMELLLLVVLVYTVEEMVKLEPMPIILP
jgi:hypothetical protein